MKIQQPSVLIPDPCNNPLAYYAIRCLKKANSEFKINVIVSSDQVSDENQWLYFYKHSAYIDSLVISKNRMNSIKYLDEVIRTIETQGINIIFPASEESFKFVSKYRDKLSKLCRVVALPSEENLDTAFDKWKLHLLLKKHNILTPETVLLKEIENISQFNYPVILKPVDGSGGKNIQKFESLEEENFQALCNYPNDAYIVQKYVPGHDIGCSVLCQDGQVLAYTIQQQLGLTKGFTPKIDKLKFVHDSAVIDIVTKTMNVLKWNGVANLDLRYNSQTGQINVIEINPRFWQSLMGSLSVGVNFPYILYLLSNNINFEKISYKEQYYAKFHRFIQDAFNGSLEYSLFDTNVKYFLSDPSGILHFLFYKLIKQKLLQNMKSIFSLQSQKLQNVK
ncbi:ATP-grasp domain-containing protein [Nostoc sp. ATCC 53789]|uniref:ATP-grasp domain-containing protein n=1 Tax=Nostoc sp. ATCC 53789 TaxID=76335 RepID=UPI000DECFB11|nr:ATP-grasp domain-containing protein [Nostoc sp. ATCC 53789]QHG18517.1 ATP-grasp domain-containing protein [Nostoc sp. ATCC 53789]RCJ30394.1 ATP-utilizing enzyme (ATP-grasp superfamily) [Nostoc sp. ATCC 53789]